MHLPARTVVASTAVAALLATMPAASTTAEPANPIPPPLRTVAMSTTTVATPAATVSVSASAAPRPETTHTSATVSHTAMRNALAKIGAPYRWGAAGPSAFDCSGLVYWAYRKAGVTLPRTSRAMSKIGIPVAESDLRPGDLVFFYRPVSHVGIYIGDGKVVHASTYTSPVKISLMAYMPFNSARRIVAA